MTIWAGAGWSGKPVSMRGDCPCGCGEWNANWSRPAPRVLASYSNGRYDELLKLTEPSKQRYADHWGYDLTLRYSLPAPQGRVESWNRIALALELLESYTEVLIVDADAMFARQAGCPFPWHLMTEQGATHAIVVQDTTEGPVPSCGVMGFNRGAVPMLEAIWASDKWATTGWLEQAVYMELLGYDLTVRPIVPIALPESVYQLPQKWNASRHNNKLGDDAIIRHATGMGDSFEWKVKLLTEWTAS